MDNYGKLYKSIPPYLSTENGVALKIPCMTITVGWSTGKI